MFPVAQSAETVSSPGAGTLAQKEPCDRTFVLAAKDACGDVNEADPGLDPSNLLHPWRDKKAPRQNNPRALSQTTWLAGWCCQHWPSTPRPHVVARRGLARLELSRTKLPSDCWRWKKQSFQTCHQRHARVHGRSDLDWIGSLRGSDCLAHHHFQDDPLQSCRAHLDFRLATLVTLASGLSRSADRGFGWPQERMEKQT